jgi:hypothetical protein
MRFQIGGQGWPITGRLIPAATIVGDGGIPLSELPSPMPMDSVALDDEALAMLRQWYPDHHYALKAGPDVGKAPTAQTESETSSVAPSRKRKGV